MKDRIDKLLGIFIWIYSVITFVGYATVYYKGCGETWEYLTTLIFYEVRPQNYSCPYTDEILDLPLHVPEFFALLPVVIILTAVIGRYILSGKTFQK